MENMKCVLQFKVDVTFTIFVVGLRGKSKVIISSFLLAFSGPFIQLKQIFSDLLPVNIIRQIKLIYENKDQHNYVP